MTFKKWGHYPKLKGSWTHFGKVMESLGRWGPLGFPFTPQIICGFPQEDPADPHASIAPPRQKTVGLPCWCSVGNQPFRVLGMNRKGIPSKETIGDGL